MTAKRKKQKMDELAREYHDTHDPETQKRFTDSPPAD
jgi:hypothetical protein